MILYILVRWFGRRSAPRVPGTQTLHSKVKAQSLVEASGDQWHPQQLTERGTCQLTSRLLMELVIDTTYKQRKDSYYYLDCLFNSLSNWVAFLPFF